jgi:methionyl-tRNA formyltransferase
MSRLRVIFMGTPAFAKAALQIILDQNICDVVAVYTQPPRPKGRGQAIQISDVHALADQHSIPVFTPVSFKKDPDSIEFFKGLKADIAVVAAYGLLLPSDILSAPTFGCLNIHGSLLPRWRGASPIQHSVWYDDPITGVTIMQMDKGLDTGDMILKSTIQITNTSTTESLYRDLSIMGGEMICDVLQKISNGETLNLERQDESSATYARLLKKDDGIIDWNKPARQIDCAVRALNPWPSTVTHIGDKRFKILSGMVVDGIHKAQVGTILNDDGDIVSGDGTTYRAVIIQPENSKAIQCKDALHGGYFKVGDQFK